MTSSGAASWVKFFTTAGIDNKIAATYAHIFVENRIRTDMLSELNKEYLREMGITVMGDIISILRHAKIVNDQNVRDKILSSNTEPIVVNKTLKAVAKIRPASPIQVRSTPLSSVAVTQPRRVLPEHEGKYKVSLPKGSTKKSREILAKHSAMQMDKIEKKSIFERLNPKTEDIDMSDESSSENSLTKLTKVSKSIFNRLGGYEVDKKIKDNSIEFAGILKNSPTKQPPRGIVKNKIVPVQRISIAKRIQVKAPPVNVDSEMSEDDEKMDSDEYKQVSFSPEVEVLEIEPRQANNNLKLNAKKLNRLKNLRADGIKSRLGMDVKVKRTIDNNVKSLHTIRKTVNMKPSKNVSSPRNSKMKADQSPISVKSRLDIRSKLKPGLNRFNQNGKKAISSSVFNRLGKKNN
ncbi:hypothetical protein PVAND_005953 [Polypedilum vanderplanki]|uniref:SAM domain-containing protein n=1 Tax=Polypedilum vanderplanki TaxID=319348 RepID=A0A9J6C2R1_POLVA|nr:hypothetical protein PVAND_005953 [Polypedilum vanderplanki]